VVLGLGMANCGLGDKVVIGCICLDLLGTACRSAGKFQAADISRRGAEGAEVEWTLNAQGDGVEIIVNGRRASCLPSIQRIRFVCADNRAREPNKSENSKAEHMKLLP